MESFCLELLRVLDRPPCSMNVIFVGARRIRLLNAQYRDRDHATDVLSFPYPGETVKGLPFLGEVVISPHVALAHSLEWMTPVEDELRKLLVHGSLHLLGYDHETDRGEMNRLQGRLLRSRALSRIGPVAETEGWK